MKFRTMYTAEQLPAQACPDINYDNFQEVPPFATDPETGEVINNTSHIKRVSTGSFSMQEFIQSFADSCSLASLLAKVKSTGDMTLLHQSNAEHGVELPSDPVELKRLSDQVDTVTAALEKVEAQAKSRAMLSGLSDQDLDQLLAALEARTKKGE